MNTFVKIGFLRIAIVVLIVLFLGIASLQSAAQPGSFPPAQAGITAVPTPTSLDGPDEIRDIELAVLTEIAARQDGTLLYSITSTQFDRVAVSEDRKYAFAWIGLADSTNQNIIPSEPGMALLQQEIDEWQAVLPGDPLWETWLDETPEDLISLEDKEYWQTINAVYADALPDAPISGYRLPWEAGKTVYLSGSVAHDSYITSGNSHYAFDFYVPGVMFPLFASRAGTVYLLHDSQPNGDESSPGNYLVLKDTTTDPVTYQLYLHLAQGSIPAELRTIGVPVARGQFIGLADDTGASTGHHLHFQVQTNPLSYWGRSIDITFDDVSINGGRPRITKDLAYCTWPGDVCNTTQTAYVSGNSKSDPNPPTGGLVGYKNGDTILTPTIKIDGWAMDGESGLKSVQIVTAYNGEMHDIGPLFTTSPFSYTFNVCQASVPDGPVSLGLRIFDKQSNIAYLPGLVTLTKNFRCEIPSPACQAGPSQVALFALPDYQGACVVLGVGDHSFSAFPAIGDNNVESVQVGTDVGATLFVDGINQGRSETILVNDSNLQDNQVGSNTLSFISIRLKSQAPSTPQPVYPLANSTYTSGKGLTFYWRNSGGAVEFQVELNGPLGSLTSSWYNVPYWTPGSELASLTPGSYTWRVRGRSPAGTSGWSQPQGFTVATPEIISPISGSLPFQDDVETDRGWRSSGLWHQEAGTSPIPAHSGNYYFWFGEASNGDERYYTAKQGELSSPVFTLPPGSKHYLRFWYAYQTENNSKFWDQRWLQISVNDGPFINIVQLYGETMNLPGYAVWVPSPVVDLSSYAGSEVQIRFYFDTIDPSGAAPDNDFEGWYIDDITITTQPPASCLPASEPNGDTNQATEVNYSPGTLLTGEICPQGDLDYFKFWGSAGDWVTGDIDAQELGSNLDSILTLYDSDGRSVLAVNDDQDFSAGNLDSLLSYQIRRTGWYYLKVRSWDYPAGGENYPYTLELVSDATPPELDLTMQDGSIVGVGPILLQARASDGQSGLDRVAFYWHSPDWADPKWTYLGDGDQSGEFWQVTFDPTGKLEGKGGAFYAIAYDRGGNSWADGAWDIVLDRTPPSTSAIQLSPTQTSNAILVQWNGQDGLSGLSGIDLQQSIDGGAWQTVGGRFFHPQLSTWLLVEPGHLYAYRTRGIDNAGNLEIYPPAEDTVTYVPPAAQLCTTLDGQENDSTWELAKTIIPEDPERTYNFCNPAGGSYQNDQDWIRVPISEAGQYSVLAIPGSSGSAFIQMTLYQKQSNVLIELNHKSSMGHGQLIWLTWIAQGESEYYLQVSSVVPELIGVGTVYRIGIHNGPPGQIFLPVIQR